MRTILISGFLLCFTVLSAQNYIPLKKHRNQVKYRDYAVIEGLYVTRHPILSLCYKHELRLYDIRNRQYFTLTVKPRFNGSDTTYFKYSIPQGTYSLLNVSTKLIGFFKTKTGILPVKRTVLEDNAVIEDAKGTMTFENRENAVLLFRKDNPVGLIHLTIEQDHCGVSVK